MTDDTNLDGIPTEDEAAAAERARIEELELKAALYDEDQAAKVERAAQLAPGEAVNLDGEVYETAPYSDSPVEGKPTHDLAPLVHEGDGATYDADDVEQAEPPQADAVSVGNATANAGKDEPQT